MRHLFVLFLIVVFLGSAYALDLGPNLGNSPPPKPHNHVGMNPGQPDGREGGEDMASAILIPMLPFSDTGNTSDNIDDYDAVCPYSGSESPDVVYSYFPLENKVISVDLCGSSYDTKTYIYEGSGNLVACNDDFYFDDTCGTYVSLIEDAYLYAGQLYYIVIDGYGGDGGDYILEINEHAPPEPCVIECDGYQEGEPALGIGYVDTWNSGCNDESGLYPFQYLDGSDYGELTLCGKAGWYSPDGVSTFRDTDWYIAVIGPYGMIEWTADAELETYIFELRPQDCSTTGVFQQAIVGPCQPGTMVIQGNPGDIVWIWVGSTVFEAPPGFDGYEYNYICDFIGLEESVTATDNISFDGIKSLYR